MSSAARKTVAEPPTTAPENDPVWAALMRAPVGPPDTEEERAILDEARARAVSIPGSVVSAEVAERCRRGA